MNSVKMCSALIAVAAAEGVLRTKEHLTGSLEPYIESANFAVSYALELCSGLCIDLGSPDDPYEDFGPEPLTHNDAGDQIPAFLEQCRLLLQARLKPQQGYPFPAMAARMQTFASLLRESEADSA